MLKMTRRQLLSKGLSAVLFAAPVAGAYSFAVEPSWLRLKKYELASAKWPQDYKTLRIAIAGDLHVGCPSVGLEEVDRIVNDLNALNADIILLLGDFLIGGVVLGRFIGPQPIADKLAALKAPLGVYSVLGNHDWWKDGQGMWKALESAGIRVLENDSVFIKSDGGGFWLSGLADDTTRMPDIGATLAKVTDDKPLIMMTHDPATFLEMTGRPVVTLAGHTHGGQVAFPVIGPVIVPGRSPLKYAYGHIREQERDLIVTSGVGTSILPVRFGRRPEIIELVIRYLSPFEVIKDRMTGL